MFLNFYKSAPMALVSTIVLLITFLPPRLIAINYDFVDFADRFECGDFFLNSFYLWWTSFYYLPTAFLAFALACVTYKLSTFPLQNIALLLMFSSLFCLEILDNWAVSTSPTLIQTSSEQFNVLLSNSVNKYHPFIFYMAVVSVIVATSSVLKPSSISNHAQSSPTLLTLFAGFLMLSFTLFLGSWWAYQEGSWGGWWNWDPSEVLGLITSLCAMRVIHSSSLGTSSLLSRYLLTFYLLNLVFAYVFIQLNFNLVSHNFGTRPDSSVGPAPMFIVSLLLILLYQTISASFRGVENLLSVLAFRFHPLSRPLDPLIVQLGTVLLFSAVLVYLSFLPVFNDFLGRFFGSALATSASPNSVYTTYLLALFTLPFWSISPFIVLGLLYRVPYFFYATLSLLVPLSSLRQLIHFLLTTFLFLCTASILKASSTWGVFSTPSSTGSFFTCVVDRSKPYLSLSYPFFESCENSLLSNLFHESVWGFERRGSAVTRYLSHQITQDVSWQSLHTGSLSRTFDVSTFDAQVPAVLLSSFLVYVGLFRLFLRPSVIIF